MGLESHCLSPRSVRREVPYSLADRGPYPLRPVHRVTCAGETPCVPTEVVPDLPSSDRVPVETLDPGSR